MLDALQCGYRAHGKVLISAFNCLNRYVGRQVLNNALRHEHQPNQQGKGQEHTGRDSDKIGIEVAEGFGSAGKSPDSGCADSKSGGRRGKHHEDNHHHLAQVRKARFSGIVLEVGIRHKTNDRVK
ncbi:hypothetical protein SDC9_92601 [bioreactor metagenome]|uniref:Uncharacterized protein n=1 Tax=bioreactor metagenome TaxID=1076179 RepID=A0A644ZY67_9ZZZZ